MLFNEWGVTLAYGRQGQKGKSTNYSFQTKKEAQKFVHKILQNRVRAVKRNDCPYRLSFIKIHETELLDNWIKPKQQNLLSVVSIVRDFETLKNDYF